MNHFSMKGKQLSPPPTPRRNCCCFACARPKFSRTILSENEISFCVCSPPSVEGGFYGLYTRRLIGKSSVLFSLIPLPLYVHTSSLNDRQINKLYSWYGRSTANIEIYRTRNYLPEQNIETANIIRFNE